SLLMLVALSRMGSSLFWAVQDDHDPTAIVIPAPLRRWWPAAALLAAGPALMLFGQPLIHFTMAAAGPLLQPLWR
ncbi:MAG: monovalent cation/H+ antiporter subunit D, partial [Candidatus Contendobacter sp.]|nr:monovalent cation/H+ antiporter subunit D [Candidatus Contendobacter sp.]